MGLIYAGHKCDRITLAHTGTYEVRVDRVERLRQHLLPDLNHLCVGGGYPVRSDEAVLV